MRSGKIKAFTLIEMLVSMAIFGIMTVLLLQSLLLNIQLSGQINARSQIRTELEEVTSLIERDIRNSTSISSTCAASDCIMTVNDTNIEWKLVSGTPNRIVKYTKLVSQPPSAYQLAYQSGDLLSFKVPGGLDFFVNSQQDITATTTVSMANIFVTLKADAAIAVWNTNWNLGGQIRQISVATRNYSIN